MHPGAMELSVVQSVIDGGTGTRRTVILTGLNDPDRGTAEIFFDLPGERNPPMPQVLDGFVFGIIFYAMRLGQNIRVDGAITADAMHNLNEFQEAWTLWKGSRYRKIDIIPRAIIGCSTIDRKHEALAAFSGGVDSIFTLFRHAAGKVGPAAYPLHHSVLMVHGFDVPLNDQSQFEALKERTAPLLHELNLTAKTVRTNLKELWLQDWEDSFSSQLACCMHNFSHEFGYALIGSSEAYDALVLPWGSNPATDYLLSGSAMLTVHDGAGYSRTQKVGVIAQHPVATKVVKVCWEGKETYKNCGSCEKCVRTHLNFLAAGVINPTCFEAPFDYRNIRNIDVRNDTQCAELKSIVVYAKSKGVKGNWLKPLEARIKKYQSRTVIHRYLDLLKKAWKLLCYGQLEELKARVAKRLERN
jgi:hypothetical protein